MLDRVDHGNGLLELRLARPPVNALDAGLVQALTGELRAARSGAIVLSGRPGMYSAGLDVPYLQSLDDAGLAKFWVAFSDLLRAFAQCRVPLAAAITGHAPAGGTVLGIFCDYRVASDGDFRLGLNETQVGLPLPRGIYHAYERLLGTRRATLFALEGRLMNPAQALECGLVDEVASPAETVTRAGAWCRKLLALPAQDAVRLTLSYARADLARRLEHEVVDPEAMTRQWRSDETQRTLKALLEKLRGKSG